MTRATEHTPATVPLAQQAGAIPSRWRWVQPSAWTVRMLATLEQGVQGGKWFRLFDKVFSERNLLAAFQRVASNDGAAGVDRVTVRQFERGLPETLWEVADQLRHGQYQPQSIRRVHIPKPGSDETRPLGIPTGSSPFCKRCAHRQRHLLNRKGHCHRIEAKGYQDSAAAGTSGGGSPARKAASWARNSDSPAVRQRVTSWTTVSRVKSRRC
jgi:hypothetical protein